jgi:predicted transcriptional regulator
MKKPGSGGKRSPGGRKRTDAQREAQLIKIEEMSIEGISQYEIAEKFGLSQSQVSRDLKEISKRATETEPADKAKHRDQLRKVSVHMRKKLFTAYNRSTKDKEVQTKKKVVIQGAESDALKGGRKAKGPSECMEASLRSEGQCGNPAYMSEIGKCLDREAKLFGLNVVEKLELRSGDKPVQVKFVRVIQKGTIEQVTEEDIGHGPMAFSDPQPSPSLSEESPIKPLSEPPALDAAAIDDAMGDQKEVERRLKMVVVEPPSIKLERALAEFAGECARQEFKNKEHQCPI